MIRCIILLCMICLLFGCGPTGYRLSKGALQGASDYARMRTFQLQRESRQKRAALRQSRVQLRQAAEQLQMMLDEYRGYHISRIVRNLGSQTYIMSDNAGGYIYIWNKGSERALYQLMFYTDSEGFVYHTLLEYPIF